jgi:hypothetical protein
LPDEGKVKVPEILEFVKNEHIPFKRDSSSSPGFNQKLSDLLPLLK